MKNGGFNPKKAFWIAALISVIGGIFFLKVKMTFIFPGWDTTVIDANLVHFTAISSVIMSLVSFGYSYLMRGSYSKALAIFHTVASIGLILAILYLNIRYNNQAAADLPTLDASKGDIAQWLNNSSALSDTMNLKVLLTAIWLGMQIVFFAIVGIKAFRSKS